MDVDDAPHVAVVDEDDGGGDDATTSTVTTTAARALPVPAHRMTPLRTAWLALVEPLLASRGAEFVPNDAVLEEGGARILVLTGPNMSGKSTYLRQVAQIALLAQIGSFVPAESARIGVIDRVFTRVGASDRLARGESTFMVEMRETAEILAFASIRSLVILDEIGRGTSTFDGLSIAWAVAEYLHDTPGLLPRTLFATHYHELTSPASAVSCEPKPGVSARGPVCPMLQVESMTSSG